MGCGKFQMQREDVALLGPAVEAVAPFRTRGGGLTFVEITDGGPVSGRLMTRRLSPPWTAERIPGGFVVKDATGQVLAYVYAREMKAQADSAKVLTMDEARRIAANIAKLPGLLAGPG